MKRFKLDEQSISKLQDIPESGMDFWVVIGPNVFLSDNEPFVVRSNGYAAPFTTIRDYYSLTSIEEGVTFPDETETISFVDSLESVLTTSITLPSGYTPTFGAHPLLGTITLAYPAKFYRYTSKLIDDRYSGNTLRAGTYLTTFADQLFVNTGFGAIGRYALPLPVPASYEHVYTIQAGTPLKVGTVAPNYGQAGGGVEVMTTGPVPGVVFEITNRIDDY